MRIVLILSILLLFSLFVHAQDTVKPARQDTGKSVKVDTINRAKGNDDKQLKDIKERKVELHSDSAGNEPKKSSLVDTTVQNKYGDLLEDDTAYNKRYHFWIPASEVLGTLTLTVAMDRFLLKADYAKIGPVTWKYNLEKEWEWDSDLFGVNFIGHPYSGTLTFNAGRANGYNFYHSFGLAVAGSLLWEYFGENTRPSYNDIIYTPINGAFLGEILYRLSSNILDDRTRGTERVFREIAATLVDPMRGFNRLIQGKMFRHTSKEVYEKEPLNISLYGGARRINVNSNDIFGQGTTSAIINAQFDYGNPFELRSRKPFDFFKLRVDLNLGVGRKYLDNILGYGILFGKNYQVGKMALLVGGYQYYDYWDNAKFELGTIGFGGGVISKWPVSKTSNLYTRFHLVIAPFGGNGIKVRSDTSQFRDYNFVGGLEAKFETTFNLGKYATATMYYYFYVLRTYIGTAGTNNVHILKPRITVRLYKQLSIGCEYQIYYDNLYQRNLPALHSVQTEQKVFLLFFLEDKQRRGYYN
jgi:hypothetical protein